VRSSVSRWRVTPRAYRPAGQFDGLVLDYMKTHKGEPWTLVPGIAADRHKSARFRHMCLKWSGFGGRFKRSGWERNRQFAATSWRGGRRDSNPRPPGSQPRQGPRARSKPLPLQAFWPGAHGGRFSRYAWLCRDTSASQAQRMICACAARGPGQTPEAGPLREAIRIPGRPIRRTPGRIAG
jgi:hypothetical protein